MRGAALASLLVLFALAGCMESSDEDWDAYDSGRGLAFGMLLTILLVVGVVVLVVNLTQNRLSVPPPPEQPVAEVPAPDAGWEPVAPASPAPRKAAAKGATKSPKPRRPSP